MSFFRKSNNDVKHLICTGRSFQRVGAPCAKARSPQRFLGIWMEWDTRVLWGNQSLFGFTLGSVKFSGQIYIY